MIFAIQQMLKNIYLNPFEVHSVKLTKVVADGGSVNIIPGNATFSIDIRAQKNRVIDAIQFHVEHGLRNISKMFETEIVWDWYDKTPGAEVSEEAKKLRKQPLWIRSEKDFWQSRFKRRAAMISIFIRFPNLN